ncbi:MAG: hypothetical protein ACRCUI_05795 [Polymorphobacter sp.]
MRRVFMGLLLLTALPLPVTAQPSPPPISAPSPSDLAVQPLDRAPAGTTPVSTAPSMLRAAPTDTTQPRVRSVIVFGSDPCPKSTSDDEIIVCARQPDEDRYRIPPGLRTATTGIPVSPFVQDRSLMLGSAAGGAGGGVGSCSTIGPGGGTGCMQQGLNNWSNSPN